MPGTPISAHREFRFRWYRLGAEGHTVAEVCHLFGISRKTYYKWNRRDHGRDPFIMRPRKPHPQTKIHGRVRVLLVEAKRQYNYGPRKMSKYLRREIGVAIAPSTIYKFMKRRRIIKKPMRRQSWYAPMKEPFLAAKPGENVQLDVKYVPGIDGCWNYQYRFIDTVTNLQYATTLLFKDSRSTVKAYHAAERSFPFSITGIQTDNGGEFRGAFHEFLIRRGIIHRYIPKRSAPWNGKVERANRSVDDEFYLNPHRPWTTIHAYTHWYNHERPHLGKGMNGLTPYQKFLTLSGQKCHP